MNSDLNILIIEDQVIPMNYLYDILESFGYKNIYKADCFDKANDIVKIKQIDLIFMDININGPVDGIMAAKQLNRDYFLPIIYTTAYGDSNTISEAVETNIFGYLIKPFRENEVKVVLEIALKRIKLIKKEDLETRTIIDFGNERYYNLKEQTFYYQDTSISLTKMENRVLYLLCKNINRNVTYEMLIIDVWEGKTISTSTIRDTIFRLKKKLVDINIDNVVDIGYILRN